MRIEDVARLAGVRPALVRRFLADPESLPPRKRYAIESAAGKMKYPLAGGNASSGFRRIAVITPFSTAYSFIERVRGVTRTLSHDDYEVVQYNVESVSQLNSHLRTMTREQIVDGIILISLPLDEDNAERIKHSGIPLVCVERIHSGFPGVSVDNVEGGRLAGSYLLKKGYRRPAYIGDGGNPEYAYGAAVLRLRGFEDAMAAAGVDMPKDWKSFHPLGADFVPPVVAKLVALPEPPDCLFCASDLEAVVAMQTARDLGLQVPGDLAILGFDNIELADYLGLSTVDQFLEKSGRDAAEILVRLIDGCRPDASPRMYELNIKERLTT